MRRSLLFSCALHGVIVLIALATTPRRAAHESVVAAELALATAAPPSPPVAVDVDVLASTGGGGPAQPAEPSVMTSARPHRRSPVASRALPTEAPPATDDGAVEVAPAAPAAGPSGVPAAEAAGAGDGASAGNGLGDGLGDGFGPGAGGTAMSRELHARVLGNEAVDVAAPIRSQRVIDRFVPLRSALARLAANGDARDLAERIATLRR